MSVAATAHPDHRQRPMPVAIALATLLASAGAIHLALIPEHLAQSTLLGLGFCAAATAQLGLAALVVLRPSRLALMAVIVVSLALVGLYAYNVTVGLPFHPSALDSQAAAAHDEAGSHGSADHGHGEDAGEHGQSGLALGAGEPVDGLGAATQAVELSSVALGFYLLSRAPYGRRAPFAGPGVHALT